jgi:tricorn protease
MRFADVHEPHVVFTYEGDLWLASTSGGDARRITNDSGEERYAKFSPDGSRIAFTASFDGGRDVYVMDARGGIPRRLTYHPAADNVLDCRRNRSCARAAAAQARTLYRVSVDGGWSSGCR